MSPRHTGIVAGVDAARLVIVLGPELSRGPAFVAAAAGDHHGGRSGFAIVPDDIKELAEPTLEPRQDDADFESPQGSQTPNSLRAVSG